MQVYETPIGPENFKRVTIRGRGKAHRAILFFASGPTELFPNGRRQHLTASCNCPGSMNGRMVNRCVIIADGWEKANCLN